VPTSEDQRDLRDQRLLAVRDAAEATRDRDHGLHLLTECATELLDVDFGFVSLVGDEHEVLLAVARPELGALPGSLPVDASLCRHLVATGRPLVVPDLGADPVLSLLSEVKALGLRSYVGMPVVTPDGLLLGGFCVGHRQPRQWTPHELTVLRRLADSAGNELRLLVALHDLQRVREADRRRAEQEAALHRVASAVARGDSPAEVLDQVTRELTRLLSVSSALVLRFLPDGRAEVAACARPDGSTGSADWSGSANAVAQVRGTGTSALGRNGDDPCAAVPILIGGRTWGAVVVVSPQAGEERTLRQLERLADFISLVVVNTEAQRQLVEQARTDPLTGAANRRAFDERLAEELERAARHGTPLVLALLDVDHFKQVNDAHGHVVGDRVLEELAERVGRQLRSADLLARLGGDEWALLLPGAGYEEASVVVDRVRSEVAALPLAGVPLTVTIGAAVAPDGHLGPGTLYRAADQALYDAKAGGRNAVTICRLD
jgi:diguanylate cyclase (GGDEF)-like protein